MTKKKTCKYEVVAVYEGENIMTACAKSLPDARKIVKTKALPKMRRKEEASDAFIEIRKLGKYKYGDFDSVENLYPDEIWEG